MPSTFFQCKITNIIMTTNIRPNLKRRYGTQSSSRSNHKSNVQDLIPVPKRHNPGFNNVSYIRTPQLLVKVAIAAPHRSSWRTIFTLFRVPTSGASPARVPPARPLVHFVTLVWTTMANYELLSDAPILILVQVSYYFSILVE